LSYGESLISEDESITSLPQLPAKKGGKA